MPQPIAQPTVAHSSVTCPPGGLVYRLIGYAQPYPGSPFQPVADTLEALVAAYHSLPAVIPGPLASEGAASIKWTTKYGTAPASITMILEGSNNNSSWTTIDTSTNVSGETRTVTNQAYQFYRATVSAISGASPTGEVLLQVIAG
jgi:hypothetical protein